MKIKNQTLFDALAAVKDGNRIYHQGTEAIWKDDRLLWKHNQATVPVCDITMSSVWEIVEEKKTLSDKIFDRQAVYDAEASIPGNYRFGCYVVDVKESMQKIIERFSKELTFPDDCINIIKEELGKRLL